MPALSLSCRVCATEHPLVATGSCTSCFGPLDPVYDWGEVEREFTPEAIAAGPRSIWRYAPLLPVAPPAEPRLAPGLTPLVPAPRLADALERPGVAGPVDRFDGKAAVGRDLAHRRYIVSP